MPAPLIVAGFAWFAGVLGGLFASAAAYITKRVVWRLSVVVALVTAAASLTLGLMTAAHASIAALTQSLPEGATLAGNLFLPTNLGACLGVIASAHVLRWVYDWQVSLLMAKFQS